MTIDKRGVHTEGKFPTVFPKTETLLSKFPKTGIMGNLSTKNPAMLIPTSIAMTRFSKRPKKGGKTDQLFCPET